MSDDLAQEFQDDMEMKRRVAMIEDTLTAAIPVITRLAATLETMLIARSIESFAVAAEAMHNINEGRSREDLMSLLRERVASIGADGIGSADTNPEQGGRGEFMPDGKYRTPNGTEWDLS